MIRTTLFGARSRKEAHTDDSISNISVWRDASTGAVTAVDIWALAPDGKNVSMEIRGGALTNLINQLKGA